MGFCCQTSDPMISVSLFKYVTINSFCKVKLISKLRLAKLHGQKPSSFNHSYQLLINYIHIYKDALNSWNLPKKELQSCTYYIDFNLWFTSLRNRVQHHPLSPPPTQTDRQKSYTLTTWTVFGRPPSKTGSEGHTEDSNERTDWSGSPAVRLQSAPRSGTTVSRNGRVNNKHKMSGSNLGKQGVLT